MVAILVADIDAVAEQRRERGIDKIDERWEGTWHFVNPPKQWHAKLNADLLRVLAPLADGRGLGAYGDATGVFAAEKDWRVPDQVYARPEQATEDGVIGAGLVVELRSPGDETYAKLDCYAARGIAEVLVVDRERTVELYRLRADGRYALLDTARSEALDVTLLTVEGPRLRVEWDGGSAEV